MIYIIWMVVNMFCTALCVSAYCEFRKFNNFVFIAVVLTMLSWLLFTLEFQNEVCV